MMLNNGLNNVNFKRIFPNSFTFGNMTCGFLSIVYSAEGEFITAAWLIIIATLCDALDGVVARLTKTTNQFGVELDSLADVISFGAAPAYLIYTYQLHDYSSVGLVIAIFFLLAGGFRLARFNTQLTSFDKEYFVGLPIPSAAITVASFVLISLDNIAFRTFFEPYILYLILAISLLMISRIKYDSIPSFKFDVLKARPIFPLLILASLIAAIITKGEAIFYVFLLFISFEILRSLIYKLKIIPSKK